MSDTAINQLFSLANYGDDFPIVFQNLSNLLDPKDKVESPSNEALIAAELTTFKRLVLNRLNPVSEDSLEIQEIKPKLMAFTNSFLDSMIARYSGKATIYRPMSSEALIEPLELLKRYDFLSIRILLIYIQRRLNPGSFPELANIDVKIESTTINFISPENNSLDAIPIQTTGNSMQDQPALLLFTANTVEEFVIASRLASAITLAIHHTLYPTEIDVIKMELANQANVTPMTTRILTELSSKGLDIRGIDEQVATKIFNLINSLTKEGVLEAIKIHESEPAELHGVMVNALFEDLYRRYRKEFKQILMMAIQPNNVGSLLNDPSKFPDLLYKIMVIYDDIYRQTTDTLKNTNLQVSDLYPNLINKILLLYSYFSIFQYYPLDEDEA